MTAVPTVLDDRFRAAAAASGELDVAYDLLDDTPVGRLLVGVRAHDDVRHAGRAGGSSARSARRRHGHEPEPAADRSPLPSRRRSERQPHRLRRGPRPEGVAPPARGRPSVAPSAVSAIMPA